MMACQDCFDGRCTCMRDYAARESKTVYHRDDFNRGDEVEITHTVRGTISSIQSDHLSLRRENGGATSCPRYSEIKAVTMIAPAVPQPIAWPPQLGDVWVSTNKAGDRKYFTVVKSAGGYTLEWIDDHKTIHRIPQWKDRPDKNTTWEMVFRRAR